MEKKLYRNTKNKMLAGVCSGLADYFNLDATVVRLLLVLFVCMGGAGILAYIACAFIIPENPEDNPTV